jgi:phosphoribosylaminoimidazole-succinocarboxamide synthase
MLAPKDFLYEGKAKRLYSVDGKPELVWVEYKDDLTAFNAQKKGSFSGKGETNFEICRLIFERLQKSGVTTHLRECPKPGVMVVDRLEMIPLEVVVRNWLAGSTAKKFAIEEGTPLKKPLVEFYYKKDELNDPFISDDQALMLEIATREELERLKVLGLQVNAELVKIFSACGIRLVDFKIEFGRNMRGEIVLGDEISPDSCRLWDEKTLEKLDKDRFRRDLGDVEGKYREVLARLQSM